MRVNTVYTIRTADECTETSVRHLVQPRKELRHDGIVLMLLVEPLVAVDAAVLCKGGQGAFALLQRCLQHLLHDGTRPVKLCGQGPDLLSPPCHQLAPAGFEDRKPAVVER